MKEELLFYIVYDFEGVIKNIYFSRMDPLSFDSIK